MSRLPFILLSFVLWFADIIWLIIICSGLFVINFRFCSLVVCLVYLFFSWDKSDSFLILLRVCLNLFLDLILTILVWVGWLVGWLVGVNFFVVVLTFWYCLRPQGSEFRSGVLLKGKWQGLPLPLPVAKITENFLSSRNISMLKILQHPAEPNSASLKLRQYVLFFSKRRKQPVIHHYTGKNSKAGHHLSF